MSFNSIELWRPTNIELTGIDCTVNPRYIDTQFIDILVNRRQWLVPTNTCLYFDRPTKIVVVPTLDTPISYLLDSTVLPLGVFTKDLAFALLFKTETSLIEVRYLWSHHLPPQSFRAVENAEHNSPLAKGAAQSFFGGMQGGGIVWSKAATQEARAAERRGPLSLVGAHEFELVAITAIHVWRRASERESRGLILLSNWFDCACAFHSFCKRALRLVIASTNSCGDRLRNDGRRHRMMRDKLLWRQRQNSGTIDSKWPELELLACLTMEIK